MDEDLDFAVLTDQDLKDRIASVALSADSPQVQRKLDVMRAELINRIRARGSGRGDRGGPDDPSGVRVPKRPTPPSGTGAMQMSRTGEAH